MIGFHIHRFQAQRRGAGGAPVGSEVGLRAHAGWTDNTMIARYVKTASEQLAAEEFDRLDLSVREL